MTGNAWDPPHVVRLAFTPEEAKIVRASVLADLRAKVESLHAEAYRTSAWNDIDVGQLTAYRKVLALIDEGHVK